MSRVVAPRVPGDRAIRRAPTVRRAPEAPNDVTVLRAGPAMEPRDGMVRPLAMALRVVRVLPAVMERLAAMQRPLATVLPGGVAPRDGTVRPPAMAPRDETVLLAVMEPLAVRVRRVVRDLLAVTVRPSVMVLPDGTALSAAMVAPPVMARRGVTALHDATVRPPAMALLGVRVLRDGTVRRLGTARPAGSTRHVGADSTAGERGAPPALAAMDDEPIRSGGCCGIAWARRADLVTMIRRFPTTSCPPISIAGRVPT